MAVINTGTAANKIPSGTTLERPNIPVKGHFRFNIDYFLFEYYNGSNWILMRL